MSNPDKSYFKIFAISTGVAILSLLIVSLTAFVFATSEENLSAMELPAIFAMVGLTGLNSFWMTKKYPGKPKINVIMICFLPLVILLGYLLLQPDPAALR